MTPASKVLNSETLFAEYRKLVSRPQYSVVDRGPDGADFTEMRAIVGAERIEETNEHRLALAARVLATATQMLEYEQHLDKLDGQTPPPQHDVLPGGYN